MDIEMFELASILTMHMRDSYMHLSEK